MAEELTRLYAQLVPAEMWDGRDWRAVHPLHLTEAQFLRWMELQRANVDGGRRSIGGSNAAGILGKSRYRTPAGVWDFILRLTQDNYDEQAGGYKERGIALEPHVANLYTRKTDRSLVVPNRGRPYVHRKYDFLTANPDYFIDDLVGRGILEIKTVYADELARIKDEGVRDEHAIQLQHYLNVCDLQWGSFAIFNADNWALYWFDVARDDRFCGLIESRCVEFWHEHVLKRARPDELVASPAPIGVPKTGGEAANMSTDADWVAAAQAYARAKADEKLSTHAVELARARIEELLTRDNVSRVIVNGHKFMYEAQGGQKRLDRAAFGRDHPGIDLTQYERQDQNRPLRFWPAKEGDGRRWQNGR